MKNKISNEALMNILLGLILACLVLLIYLVVSFFDFKSNFKEVDFERIKDITSEIKTEAHTHVPYSLYDWDSIEESKKIEKYEGWTCKDVSFSDMGYSTPIFKYIPIKINGWVVDQSIQMKLYEKCKKYDINYIQALAIMYAEGARNNQYAVHTNDNGTQDIGIMQFNTSNEDILQKMTNSTDIEWLKDIDTNLNCACYLISRNEKYCEEIECLYDSLVVYNGGIKSLRKIKSGEYTLTCSPSMYAAKVISYMDSLYSYYFLNIDVNSFI